jgi:hypothetical protein
MRLIITSLFILMIYTSVQSQNTRNVGLMVWIEDSLTHNFIGAASNIVQKYSAPADFQAYAIDTALVLLKQNFPKWNFCTMENDNFLVYEENRANLRAPDFRNFREIWFNTLKEDFEVDAILVIRNSTGFTDPIHWSNTLLEGYGIYNGSKKAENNAYIQLEFLFFDSGRPLTHIQGPIFQTDRKFPRIDKKEVLFDESELLLVEEPIKHLIVSQIEAAVRDRNLMRVLR